MTAAERYRALEARYLGGGLSPADEDALLEEMDEAWASMTKEERDDWALNRVTP